MKKKIVAATLTVMMTCGLLAACGGSNTGSSASGRSASNASAASSAASESASSSAGESAAEENSSASSALSGDAETDKEMNIMVILKTNSSEVGKYLQAGAEDYEEAHPNIHVDVTGATSETSYDEQINMIETASESGKYDAIVLDPLQADAAGNILKDCTVPVISFDTEIGGGVSATYVGVGNEKAAKLGGDTVTKAAKDLGWDDIQCIEIAGVQGDPTNEARAKGYKEGVNESEYPSRTIIRTGWCGTFYTIFTVLFVQTGVKLRYSYQ